MIKANPLISTSDMATELGISIATVKRKIKKMQNVSYKVKNYNGRSALKSSTILFKLLKEINVNSGEI